MLEPAVSHRPVFIGGLLPRANRCSIVIFRSLEESGIFHMDPAGGRATGFACGALASDAASRFLDRKSQLPPALPSLKERHLTLLHGRAHGHND